MAVRKLILNDRIVIEQTTYYEYADQKAIDNNKWDCSSSKSIYFIAPDQLQKENEELKLKNDQIIDFTEKLLRVAGNLQHVDHIKMKKEFEKLK